MYIGLAADPTWIQEVFGVQTAAQIDIDKTRLLDRETPASQRVRTVIGMSDYINKGGIILEKITLWLKSPKKRCQITLLDSIHLKKRCSRD